MSNTPGAIEREERLDVVLAEYWRVTEAGKPVDRQQLLAREAELAIELAEHFADLDRIEEMTAPLRKQHTGSRPLTSSAKLGSTLGDFRLLRETGRGGMGIVFEAEQISLRRRVAVKVLPLMSALDPKQLQRFKNEAQAAANLRHPNIVAVYSVGEDQDAHYFAMEFIEGNSLAETINAFKSRSEQEPVLAPAVRARNLAQLTLQAAEALEHAHQLGVIHRDIKPGNLLTDKKGHLWVTDFGLAQIHDNPRITMSGDLLGTLRYMSPEQALGNRLNLDHRTDIYSLGVTLYELLALKPAFPGVDRQEILRQIAFEEPCSLRSLNADVPVELETIVLKAMSKDREDRYATANLFAQDLGRFLRDEPILARRPGLWLRARKWAYRHRSLVAITLTFLFTLLLLAVAGLSLSRALISHEAREKDRALIKANDNWVRAEKFGEENRLLLVDTLVKQGNRLIADGDALAALPWFAQAMTHDRKDAARQALHKTRLAAVLRQAPRLVRYWFHAAGVRHVEVSPDGRLVVTASDDGKVQVWNLASGQAVSGPLHHDLPVWRAVFSPDGKHLITACANGPAFIWLAATGKQVARLDCGAAVKWFSFNADGSRTVTACANGIVQIWNVVDGKPVRSPWKHDYPTWQASFSPDGQGILVSGWRSSSPGTYIGEARLWSVDSGATVARFAVGSCVRVAWFSPDGKRILTANTVGEAHVWDAATGKLCFALTGSQAAERVIFRPDGERIATWNQFGIVRIWNARTGQATTPELKHTTRVQVAGFSADGERLFICCVDGTVHIRDAAGNPVTTPLHHVGAVNHAVFSPDGRLLVTANDDQTACVWDLDGFGSVLFDKNMPGQGSRNHVVFSPDGKRLLTAGEDQPVRSWDLSTGLVKEWPDSLGVTQIEFSGGGNRVLTVALTGNARIWDAASGVPLTDPLIGKQGSVVHAALSPDARHVVTGGLNGAALVWDLRNKAFKTLNHDAALRLASFSPDGKFVLTADYVDTRLWRPAGGELVLTIKHKCNVALFSPDSTRFFTGLSDGSGQIWHTLTGQRVGIPLRHGTILRMARFSPDGNSIVTASDDGTARLWDASTGQPLGPPLRHDVRVRVAMFSPNGKVVVTGGDDGMIRLWDAATSESLGPPLKHDSNLEWASFSPDSRFLATMTAGRRVRIWDIQAVILPADDLMLMSQLHSATRFDTKNNLVRLEFAEMQSAWNKLSCKYPNEYGLHPGPELLTAATDATTQNEMTGVFTWTPIPRASVYHLIVTDQHKAMIDEPALVKTSFRAVLPPQASSTVTWKVRALVAGVWTAWRSESCPGRLNEDKDRSASN